MTKKIKTVLATIAISVLTLNPINAYTKQNYGSKTPTIQFKVSADKKYNDDILRSMKAWNEAVPGVSITTNKKASNVIFSGYYNTNWVGYYTWVTNSKGEVTSFNIYINEKHLNGKSDEFIQSVIVHELGHALSLADNPPNAVSIMQYSRNRNVMYVPQKDDIEGVKNIYNLN